MALPSQTPRSRFVLVLLVLTSLTIILLTARDSSLASSARGLARAQRGAAQFGDGGAAYGQGRCAGDGWVGTVD